jgi:D-alanyl-D-alanine carboxypeptidase
MPGADGIKTGYTRAAGFNLVASAQRGQERIIATVFGGRSAAWRNQRIMELLDMGFARAPSHATIRVPGLPQYDTDGPASRTARPNGLVSRSLRPLPRGLREPEAALVAAIDEAVEDAVGQALMEPAPRPSAVAPEAVARALTEALEPGGRGHRPRFPEATAAAPLPRPEAQATFIAPPPRPRRGGGRHARLFHRIAALRSVAGDRRIRITRPSGFSCRRLWRSSGPSTTR